MKKLVAKGWRWEIWVKVKNNQKIATKQSVSEWKKGTLLKEVDILRYLEKQWIDFVPKVLGTGDGWFSYEWIEGEHFEKEYRMQNTETRKQLAVKLLKRAYELDKVWVIHGELLRPWTNVLVVEKKEKWKRKQDVGSDKNNVYILDLERGEMGDYSGKNMKHVAQRLAREWYMGVDEVKSLWALTADEIYTRIWWVLDQADRMDDTPEDDTGSSIATDVDEFGAHRDELLLSGLSILHIMFLPALLVAVDQMTKLWLYDYQAHAASDWITASFNTGIAWSIPLPMIVVISVSFGFFGVLVWRYLTELKTIDTDHNIWSLFVLEYGTILVLAWGIGNVIDRVWLGWVRDFIDVSPLITFYDWPIFNFADVFVVVGVGLLLWYNLTNSD